MTLEVVNEKIKRIANQRNAFSAAAEPRDSRPKPWLLCTHPGKHLRRLLDAGAVVQASFSHPVLIALSYYGTCTTSWAWAAAPSGSAGCRFSLSGRRTESGWLVAVYTNLLQFQGRPRRTAVQVARILAVRSRFRYAADGFIAGLRRNGKTRLSLTLYELDIHLSAR